MDKDQVRINIILTGEAARIWNETPKGDRQGMVNAAIIAAMSPEEVERARAALTAALVALQKGG